MAYLSFKPTDYFNTKLYTGDGSASQAQTGLGFQPDFNWTKARGLVEGQVLFDSVRGATQTIYSNATAAQSAIPSNLISFDVDGFTMGSNGEVGQNTENYASWNWKAGTTSGISGGTITPSSYSINTTSKFGIYKYSGNATSGATIAHGLGVAPTMLITKKISAVGDWHVAHQDNSAYPWNSYLYLNTTNGTQEENTATWFLNDTAPSSTLITLGNGTGINSSGVDYLIYAFADVKGFSKFGGYTGNGNVNGTFVYTGFRPNMIMIKNTSGQNWNLLDAVRNPSNVANKTFTPDTAAAEAVNGTGAGDKKIDILSNGFKIRTNSNELNQSGVNHIYMAWAQEPIVGSNDTPGVAR